MAAQWGRIRQSYMSGKSYKELSEKYRLIVVTSDRLEQVSVFSSDAFRLSSREFLARYNNMRKNLTHTEKASNRPLAGLRDLLDTDQ